MFKRWFEFCAMEGHCPLSIAISFSYPPFSFSFSFSCLAWKDGKLFPCVGQMGGLIEREKILSNCCMPVVSLSVTSFLLRARGSLRCECFFLNEQGNREFVRLCNRFFESLLWTILIKGWNLYCVFLTLFFRPIWAVVFFLFSFSLWRGILDPGIWVCFCLLNHCLAFWVERIVLFEWGTNRMFVKWNFEHSCLLTELCGGEK